MFLVWEGADTLPITVLKNDVVSQHGQEFGCFQSDWRLPGNPVGWLNEVWLWELLLYFSVSLSSCLSKYSVHSCRGSVTPGYGPVSVSKWLCDLGWSLNFNNPPDHNKLDLFSIVIGRCCWGLSLGSDYKALSLSIYRLLFIVSLYIRHWFLKVGWIKPAVADDYVSNSLGRMPSLRMKPTQRKAEQR